MLKLTEVGAWAGLAALNNPKKYIKLVKDLSLDRIDIMINDGSTKKPFHLYKSEDELIRILSEFSKADIKVSITTWAQPDSSWTAGMAVVGRIATKAGIDQVTLDIEESYINPLKNKSPVEIFTWNVGIVGTLRSHFNGVINVAPIVYTNRKIVDGILQMVDQIIPQCYATLKNVPGSGHDGSLETTTKNLYKGFGAPIVIGMAAWNLEGAYGKNAKDAFETSLLTILKLGYSEIRIWRLEFINKDILDIIKKYK